jgi:hypothetical protein
MNQLGISAEVHFNDVPSGFVYLGRMPKSMNRMLIGVSRVWQVSNPAIQFMIYETLLDRVTAKRRLKKAGIKNATAGEVSVYKIRRILLKYTVKLLPWALLSSGNFSGSLGVVRALSIEINGAVGLLLETSCSISAA